MREFAEAVKSFRGWVGKARPIKTMVGLVLPHSPDITKTSAAMFLPKGELAYERGILFGGSQPVILDTSRRRRVFSSRFARRKLGLRGSASPTTKQAGRRSGLTGGVSGGSLAA